MNTAASNPPSSRQVDSEAAIASTVAWVEKAVIGLNLCPFARAVHAGRRIRYVVTEAGSAEALIEVLVQELELLAEADPAAIETTLLIHPRVLGDFLDYNDFLDVADAAVEGRQFSSALPVRRHGAGRYRQLYQSVTVSDAAFAA